MEFWTDEEFRWQAGRSRPARRRAMVGLAFPVVLGTAAGICAPFSAAWFLGAGAVLLLPLFVWVRRGWSTGPLMLAAFFLVAAQARMSTGGRSSVSLEVAVPRPVEYVQFVAVALDDAVPRREQSGQADSAVFSARVEGLNRDGSWVRVDDRIRVALRGDPEGMRLPQYGERWRMRGVVRPGVPRRSGLFTIRENQAVVEPDRAVFLDGGRGNPIKAWCMERRRAARAVLGRGLEDFPEERGLLQSLLLGYREDLPGLLRQDFVSTGTVHIFAISGAHVGMVTMLLVGVLQALGVSRPRWFLFVTPMLIIYTITTGAATSAIRACLMASLVLAAPYLRRKSDGVSTLAAAAMAILLVAPGQLGDLGFLLSFTAVAGLLAIQPVMDAWAVRAFRRDEWQLAGEELPARRRLREAGLSLTRYGSVSVSAWIGTSPLTAFFFNLFSPVALAMNLIVIPAAFAILLAGVMSLVSAPVSGEVSEIFNHSARACAQGLSFLIRAAAAIPGGHWFVRTPPAVGVALWYAILAFSALAARRVRGALPTGVAILAVLAAAWGMRERTSCRVSALDVGEGNAVLVKAQSQRILIDVGSSFLADDTLRQLRREGVNRLEAMVLTHADADHAGGALELMRQLPVGELWMPAAMWPSPLIRDIVRAAEGMGLRVRRLSAGDEGDWSGDMYWEALWPPEDAKMARADDGALVLRVARYGASILLTSDAGVGQETAMMAQGNSLAASVLLAGRHGDAEATSEAWLDEVRPRDVLVSSGPHAEGRHPDDKMLARLATRGIRVWRTDTLGTIHVDFDDAPARWPDSGYRISAGR